MRLFSGSALVRLQNQVRGVENPDWFALKSGVTAARAYLRDLEKRFELWSLYLGALKNGVELETKFRQTLLGLGGVLRQFEVACETQKPAELAQAFEDLDQAAEELTSAVEEAQKQADQLPVFSDQKVVNDAFMAGFALLQGELSQKVALQAALPALFEWVQDLESVGTEIRTDYSEEVELQESFSTAQSDLQEALGGFLLVLERGEVTDLSLALSLLDRGARRLGACLQVLQSLRASRYRFSQDPLLETLHRKASDWLDGGTSLAEVRCALLELSQAQVVDLELARGQGFLPFTLHQNLFSRLTAEHRRMAKILESLGEETRAETFLQNLTEFRSSALLFDETLQRVAAFERPEFRSSPVFQELFEVMEDVYLERKPDRALRDALLQIRSAHQQIERRLQLSDVMSEEEQIVEQCLKEQASGFEHLKRYLATAERLELLKAYEALLPATLDLVELHFELEEEEPGESSLDAYDSEFQEARTRLFRQVRSLVESYRADEEMLEVSLEGLNSLVKLTEKAQQELELQVRPAVLTGGDQDLAGSYEQLCVILSYQLEALYGVEESMSEGDLSTLEEALAELAEVDAYLMAFEENQGKLVGSRPK